MSHSVRRHLDLEIDAYDATIRRFIPGYQAMISTAAKAVAHACPGKVVDLGAGTGSLSQAILSHAEAGVVELLDVDPEMLGHARRRLADHGERVRFTLRSYDEAFEACDAFAASLSLHHLPTLEAKTALFARAFEALPDGGVFVNADANMPDEESERRELYRYWAEHQVAQGIPEARAWAHFEEWAEEDTYLPLDRELAALHDIGFDAECVWSEGPMNVVVATRR